MTFRPEYELLDDPLVAELLDDLEDYDLSLERLVYLQQRLREAAQLEDSPVRKPGA